MNKNEDPKLLPVEIVPNGGKALLERFGVRFGAGTQDGLFQSATLPKGWTKKRVDELYVEVFDDKGRLRARSMHKDPAHVEQAHLHVVARYTARPAAAGSGTAIYDRGLDEEIFGSTAPDDGPGMMRDVPGAKVCRAWAEKQLGAAWRSPERWLDP